MTKNQQGAPEALRLAEEWRLKTQREADRQNSAYDHYGMGNTPETVDPLGAKMASELRRLAALVEAQQPATHVQNPAEIAHVAGDVSKNGPESNMAQQPVPSAAADLIAALEEARSAINSMKVEAETAAQGDEQMMLEACETISNEGLQADMAIRAALASAPQPSPTPQADSQPAPVEVADAMADSQYLAGVSAGWNAANADDPNAALQKLHESRAGYLKPLSAARAPADNVLEDAARLDWLEIAGPTSICVVIDRPHDSEVEVSTDDVTGYGKTLREALDAAREQGGAT